MPNRYVKFHMCLNWLQPETGWNTEAGFRMVVWKNRLQIDASIFRFNLTDAIVRREDGDGTEYFVNAGGTKQTGIETLISAWVIAPKSTGLFRAAQLTTGITYNHFRFNEYTVGTSDYSGNKLTGVPAHVVTTSLLIRFPLQLNLFVQSYSSGRIPLNDGNTAYADAYHVLGAKVSWTNIQAKRFGIEIFAGADNITNERYSLGNDINAFGARYYNAATSLHGYAGLVLRFR